MFRCKLFFLLFITLFTCGVSTSFAQAEDTSGFVAVRAYANPIFQLSVEGVNIKSLITSGRDRGGEISASCKSNMGGRWFISVQTNFNDAQFVYASLAEENNNLPNGITKNLSVRLPVERKKTKAYRILLSLTE